VLDSLGELFALAGIDENSDADVGPWLRLVARPIADAGAAVVSIDHTTKSTENPMHPSGSKRKRAAITGALHRVDATTAPIAGQGGRLRLRCAKDRHGHFRQSDVVADVVMRPIIGDRMAFTLYPPSTPEPSQPDDLVTDVVDVVRAAGRPLTQREVIDATPGRIRRERKRDAILEAVEIGDLIEHQDGRSKLYTTVPHVDPTGNDRGTFPSEDRQEAQTLVQQAFPTFPERSGNAPDPIVPHVPPSRTGNGERGQGTP